MESNEIRLWFPTFIKRSCDDAKFEVCDNIGVQGRSKLAVEHVVLLYERVIIAKFVDSIDERLYTFSNVFRLCWLKLILAKEKFEKALLFVSCHLIVVVVGTNGSSVDVEF